jgi:hypothetical protein
VGIRVCETLKPSVEVRDVVVAVELFDKFKKCPSAKLPDELGYSLPAQSAGLRGALGL